MKSFTTSVVRLSVVALACVLFRPLGVVTGQAATQSEQTIQITHGNAVPSSMGPVERFVGEVKLDMMTEPKEPGKPRVENITFAAGAHTAWHSHPLGQILIVTSGSGYIQQRGGAVQKIRAGDVIWTPANVQHWHGAGPDGPMTHISVYEEPPGQGTKWFEQVPDAQYRAAAQ